MIATENRIKTTQHRTGYEARTALIHTKNRKGSCFRYISTVNSAGEHNNSIQKFTEERPLNNRALRAVREHSSPWCHSIMPTHRKGVALHCDNSKPARTHRAYCINRLKEGVDNTE